MNVIADKTQFIKTIINRGQTTFSQLIEVCPYDDNQKRKGTGLAFFNALYYVISRGDSQEDILFE